MTQRGFTLPELALVLVIIGLLLSGMLGGQSMIRSTQAKDVVTKAEELRAATMYFKQRFGYLPGDWPYAAGEIANITASPGDGNGTILGAVNAQGQAAAGSEVAEAPLQLYQAGIIGSMDANDAQRRLKTSFGAIHLVSAATANGLVPNFIAQNPGARNAIVFANLPCEVAREAELKMDDGNLWGGRAMISLNPCPDESVTPWFAVVL